MALNPARLDWAKREPFRGGGGWPIHCVFELNRIGFCVKMKVIWAPIAQKWHATESFFFFEVWASEQIMHTQRWIDTDADTPSHAPLSTWGNQLIRPFSLSWRTYAVRAHEKDTIASYVPIEIVLLMCNHSLNNSTFLAQKTIRLFALFRIQTVYSIYL